jgi:hypothetical protein
LNFFFIFVRGQEIKGELVVDVLLDKDLLFWSHLTVQILVLLVFHQILELLFAFLDFDVFEFVDINVGTQAEVVRLLLKLLEQDFIVHVSSFFLEDPGIVDAVF